MGDYADPSWTLPTAVRRARRRRAPGRANLRRCRRRIRAGNARALRRRRRARARVVRSRIRRSTNGAGVGHAADPREHDRAGRRAPTRDPARDCRNASASALLRARIARARAVSASSCWKASVASRSATIEPVPSTTSRARRTRYDNAGDAITQPARRLERPYDLVRLLVVTKTSPRAAAGGVRRR